MEHADLATVSAAAVKGKTVHTAPNIAAQAGLWAAATTHLLRPGLANKAIVSNTLGWSSPTVPLCVLATKSITRPGSCCALPHERCTRDAFNARGEESQSSCCMPRQVNSHNPVLKPRAARPPLVMHDCSIDGMHSPEIGARNTCCGTRLSKSSCVRWQSRWSAGAPMVPAVLAISGVSAHACSHHRGCRVGQCVQVSGRRTTPTCATGGPLAGASDHISCCYLSHAFLSGAIKPHGFSALHLGAQYRPPARASASRPSTARNLPQVCESCAIRLRDLLHRSACPGRKLPVAATLSQVLGVSELSYTHRYGTRQQQGVTHVPFDSTGTHKQGEGHARGSTRADPSPTEALNISWDSF